MKRMISLKTFPILCLALSLLMLSACKGKPAEESAEESRTSSTTEPASKGQAIFMSQCISCHRGDGKLPGPNVVIMESKRLGTEASFKEVLRRPPSAMMPSFDAATLNDADVHALYLYLQSARHAHSK